MKVDFSKYYECESIAVMHLRYNDKGVLLPYYRGSQNRLWKPRSKGGMTVVSVVIRDCEGNIHRTMGFSRCHMEDTFSYKIGRVTAIYDALGKAGHVCFTDALMLDTEYFGRGKS